MSDQPEHRPTYKPIICIDFDGVIHAYDKGWQNGVIYGNIIPGFLAWAVEASQHFSLGVYSSRSSTESGIAAMQNWLRLKLMDQLTPKEIGEFLALLTFYSEKPPAFITIDDRAIQFRGDWTDPALSVDALRAFQPWNYPQKQTPG